MRGSAVPRCILLHTSLCDDFRMPGSNPEPRLFRARSDDAFAASLQILREFAGPSPPSALLRRLLLRAGGDANRAACLLLNDSSFSASAAAPQSTIHHVEDGGKSCAQPSALPVPSEREASPVTGSQKSVVPTVEQVRKAAWRSFYKEHYALAVQNCLPGRKDLIVAFVTDLWRSQGPDGRDMLYAKARDELSRTAEDRCNKASIEDERTIHVEPSQSASTGTRVETLKEEHSPIHSRNDGIGQHTNSSVGISEKGVNSTTNRGKCEQEKMPFVANGASSSGDAFSMRGEGSQLSAGGSCSGKNAQCINANSHRPSSETKSDGYCFGQAKPELKYLDAEGCEELSEMSTGWPKRFASQLLTCTLLISGSNVVRAGDQVELEPSAGKVVSTKGRKKSRVGSFFAPSHGKKSIAPTVVRFSRRGREIGRLPHHIASVLAPALVSGFVKAAARVIETPAVARIMDDIVLEISLSLCRDAFEHNLSNDIGEHACTMQAMNYDKSPGSCTTKGKRSGGIEDLDEGMDKSRLAIIALLERLHACEPPSRVQEGKGLLGNSQLPEDKSSERQDIEQYYNTVREMQGLNCDFVQPSALLCTLRDYQRAGVMWMLARENETPEGNKNDVHPLWKRRVFPDGTPFYVNGTVGSLSLTAPSRSAQFPKGGILADEMGLGKTIECIALILSDRAQFLSCPQGVDPKSIFHEPAHRTSKRRRVLSESEQEVSVTSFKPQDSRESEGSGSPAFSKGNPNCNVDGENVTADTEVGVSAHNSESIVRQSRNRSRAGLSSDEDDEARKECTTTNCSDERRDASLCDSMTNFGCTSREPGATDEKKIESACNSTDHNDHFSNTPVVGSGVLDRVEKHISSRQLELYDDARDLTDTDSTSIADGLQQSCACGSVRASKSVGVNNRRAWTSEVTRKGGTLLVVPMSMIQQWIGELEEHVETDCLRVRLHYGQQKGTVHDISARVADVVITSYGTVASEFSENPEATEGNLTSSPLFFLEWRRIILDEAHTIKNRSTKWAKSCFHLRGERRWCITGTPIQNHVNDLFSLFCFLKFEPWSSWGYWNREIAEKIESSSSRSKFEAMNTVRDILAPLTLRRLKSTKDSNGKPLVRLSARNIQVVHLDQPKAELNFYEALHRRSRARFDNYLAQGRILNHYGSVLEMILRLRQACCHPWLVFAAPQSDKENMEDRRKLYASFSNINSSGLVEKLVSDAEKGIVGNCPVCLDIMDDGVALKNCGHAACRICLRRVLLSSGSHATCPVCRIPIEGVSDFRTLPRHSCSRFPMDIRGNWCPSAKLTALVNDMKEMEARRTAASHGIGKAVIMSQFTSFLDLVEIALERENLKYLRLDGSMVQRKRAQVLDSFSADDEMKQSTANILLLSLKAGGVGLNLVSASLLCMADPSWNPQADIQAMARIHRHGQTRDVIVRRYVVRNSVEERLLEVQQRKLDMTDGALSTSSDDDKREARVSEMRLLFSR